MPHVPVGAFKRLFPFKEIYMAKKSDGSWGKIETVGNRNRGYAVGNVNRATSPKVVLDSGKWSLAHPYQRSASLVDCKGGPERIGNSPYEPLCTVIYNRSGYPRIDTADPLSLFPITETATGGLVAGGYAIVTPDMRSRLIAECMVKIGSRKANFGAMLGESRSTLKHLAKTSLTVLRAYRALRRGRIKQFLGLLGINKNTVLTGKLAADKWLETQYAWKPLLSDIYDTSKVLSEGVKRNSQIVSASRTIKDGAAYKSGAAHGSVSVGYRCSLYYKVSNSSIDALSRLGLINPLEVAWELVPFSFVIDWFIPVGTLLEAYSSTMGMTFIDGHISTKASIDARYEVNNPLGGYYLDEGRFTFVWGYFGFKRITVSSAAPLPYFKSPFSSNHLASAFALIRSLSR